MMVGRVVRKWKFTTVYAVAVAVGFIVLSLGRF